MTVRLTYRIDDARSLASMRGLAALAGDTTSLMRGIAAIGESSTRERFVTETAPDGERWKPSIRAQVEGGRTLTRDGHLGDSITSAYTRDTAEWGTNMIYAAIHQDGGEIRPRSAKALRFALAGGEFATVRKVTMPARPFLGLSAEDVDDILDFINERVRARMGL